MDEIDVRYTDVIGDAADGVIDEITSGLMLLDPFIVMNLELS